MTDQIEYVKRLLAQIPKGPFRYTYTFDPDEARALSALLEEVPILIRTVEELESQAEDARFDAMERDWRE